MHGSGERMHAYRHYQEAKNTMELTLELLLITILVGSIVADWQAWRRHPVLTASAALILVAGMYPGFDVVARQSVWLHSLQSLMIHHLAPLLMLLAGLNPCRILPDSTRILGSAPGATLVFVSFTGMTLLWLSPNLHVSLMESPALYSLMKWGMALSGILLCNVVARQSKVGSGDIVRGVAFNVAIAAPQTLAGIYLITSPPLYPMPGCIASPVNWLPLLDIMQDQHLGGSLLIAASAIFFLGDLQGRLRARRETLPAPT